MCVCGVCLFFEQQTAYEMRISDWSSDVCSADLAVARREFMGLGVDAEADDNTIGIVDFGDSTYAVVYGAPAGMRAQEVGGVRYFGTGGTIEDTLLNRPGESRVGKAGVSTVSSRWSPAT